MVAHSKPSAAVTMDDADKAIRIVARGLLAATARITQRFMDLVPPLELYLTVRAGAGGALPGDGSQGPVTMAELRNHVYGLVGYRTAPVAGASGTTTPADAIAHEQGRNPTFEDQVTVACQAAMLAHSGALHLRRSTLQSGRVVLQAPWNELEPTIGRTKEPNGSTMLITVPQKLVRERYAKKFGGRGARTPATPADNVVSLSERLAEITGAEDFAPNAKSREAIASAVASMPEPVLRVAVREGLGVFVGVVAEVLRTLDPSQLTAEELAAIASLKSACEQCTKAKAKK